MADWGFIDTALTSFRARHDAISTKPVEPHNLEELRLIKHVIHDLEALHTLHGEKLPCPHGRSTWHMCPHCTGNS